MQLSLSRLAGWIDSILTVCVLFSHFIPYGKSCCATSARNCISQISFWPWSQFKGSHTGCSQDSEGQKKTVAIILQLSSELILHWRERGANGLQLSSTLLLRIHLVFLTAGTVEHRWSWVCHKMYKHRPQNTSYPEATAHHCLYRLVFQPHFSACEFLHNPASSNKASFDSLVVFLCGSHYLP